MTQLPVLTAPKLDPQAPSAEIDSQVQQLVRSALSVYEIDAERLRRLEPSVILTQDQCEVCAASLSDVEGALLDWLGTKPAVISLHPKRLRDVWDDIERVAETLGAPDRGARLRAQLQQRVGEISKRAAAEQRPTVACLEWIEPLMFAGHWVPELVDLAAGRSAFGQGGERSSYLHWDDLRAADPDVIVVMPCGFDCERTRAEMAPLTRHPGWPELRAVREGPGLPHRWRSVLQPAGAAAGRLAAYPGRDPAPGDLSADAGGHCLAVALTRYLVATTRRRVAR